VELSAVLERDTLLEMLNWLFDIIMVGAAVRLVLA